MPSATTASNRESLSKGGAPLRTLMPYSMVVGQQLLKLALELTHIDPGIGGVLLSGERGTAKSTTVRAFTQAMQGRFPVTLPINATEDRVVGGWKVKSLAEGGKFEEDRGLLEVANGGVLYIDEVNLLDDHIVNLILDVASTGVLTIQREGQNREVRGVSFVLIGTMNPEEGTLRPQLLDRFGLMVGIRAEPDIVTREKILENVLHLDDEELTKKAVAEDVQLKAKMDTARELVLTVKLPPKILQLCIRMAQDLNTEGHRGEVVLARAARALAAREGRREAEPADVVRVAPLALQHRRKGTSGRPGAVWGEEDSVRVEELAETVK